MIGLLKGVIASRTMDHVVLLVGGVGYEVYCSDRTLAALPRPGEAATLYTDLLVREDLLQLFGFLSQQEKAWHKLLMGVQGVGAKAAMSIMGTLGPDGLSRAIAMGDWGSVKAAKGIGPKTAQKVVIDLKDKAPDIMAIAASDLPRLAVNPDVNAVIDLDDALQAVPSNAQADALSALKNLGYAPQEAASAVAEAAAEADTVDDLIRLALKRLAPKG